MQNYITQLLADLENAKTNKPPKVEYKLLYPDHPANDPQYEGVMDYMMEWDHAPRWAMNNLFGIKSEVFPPIEKLNEEQMLQLVNGILELWGDFNISAYIPNQDTPVQIVYKVLINYWKTETVQYISEGRLTLEFCHYDENACPWGYEFCTCKDFEEEELNMDDLPTHLDINTLGEDDLPF